MAPAKIWGRRLDQRQKEREKWQRAVEAVLKATREDLDVSRRDLGEKVGLESSQVSNLENGRAALKVIDLILIARALGIEPDVLLRRILRW